MADLRRKADFHHYRTSDEEGCLQRRGKVRPSDYGSHER